MSYSNYQLPSGAINSYYNPPPASNPMAFSSAPSRQTPTQEQALVPSYGPPPATSWSQPPAPSTVASSQDSSMAAIIASQERAMAEAKQPQPSHSFHYERPRSHSNIENHQGMVPYSNNNNNLQVQQLSDEQMRKSKKLSDAIHPHKHQMKEVRKGKTAIGASTGAVVGGIMFGPAFPIGMVLGGATGGVVANKMAKAGEKRAQRKFEQQNFQQAARESAVTNAAWC